MSRVQELEDQIQKLQQEKSKIYAEERKSALAGIKEKIALFSFTSKELGFKLPKVTEPEAKSKGPAKKAAKRAVRKAARSSGIYFDLDGRHVPAGRGRPSKEVTTFAAEKGIATDSLKRNADGTPFTK